VKTSTDTPPENAAAQKPEISPDLVRFTDWCGRPAILTALVAGLTAAVGAWSFILVAVLVGSGLISELNSVRVHRRKSTANDDGTEWTPQDANLSSEAVTILRAARNTLVQRCGLPVELARTECGCGQPDLQQCACPARLGVEIHQQHNRTLLKIGDLLATSPPQLQWALTHELRHLTPAPRTLKKTRLLWNRLGWPLLAVFISPAVLLIVAPAVWVCAIAAAQSEEIICDISAARRYSGGVSWCTDAIAMRRHVARLRVLALYIPPLHPPLRLRLVYLTALSRWTRARSAGLDQRE
jgi:hypothetical protein